MQLTMNSSSASNPTNQQAAEHSAAITPELVQEVTEKVYALMLQELKLERERAGRLRQDFKSVGGRW